MRLPPDQIPCVWFVVGIRRHGKSFRLCEIINNWPGDRKIFSVDPACPPRPRPGYPAYYGHYYASALPPELPDTRIGCVVIDEADRVLPVRGRVHPLAHELVTRGRHLGPLDRDGYPTGISVVLASQRPGLIVHTAWTQLTHLSVFRVTAKRDLDRIAEIDLDMERAIPIIRRLEVGRSVEFSLQDGVKLPDGNRRLTSLPGGKR